MNFSPGTPGIRTFRFFSAAFACLLSTAAVGCSSSSSEPPPAGAQDFPAQPFATVTSDSGKLSFSLRSQPQPLEQGPNELLLTVHDTETHEPARDLTLSMEPWMPHHDHGSSSVPEVSSLGDGQYLVRNVVFTMPGDWELRIHVTSPFEDALSPTITIH